MISTDSQLIPTDPKWPNDFRLTKTSCLEMNLPTRWQTLAAPGAALAACGMAAAACVRRAGRRGARGSRVNMAGNFGEPLGCASWGWSLSISYINVPWIAYCPATGQWRKFPKTPESGWNREEFDRFGRNRTHGYELTTNYGLMKSTATIPPSYSFERPDDWDVPGIVLPS